MTIDDFTDDVSDIRNHISPHTVVWDLASGEDYSVVIDLDAEEELEQGDGYDSE